MEEIKFRMLQIKFRMFSVILFYPVFSFFFLSHPVIHDINHYFIDLNQV